MNKMVRIYFYHNFLKLTSACRRTTRGWRDMIYSALPFLPTGKHWHIIWTTVVERSTLHTVNGGTGTGHNCHLEPYSQSYLSSNIPVVVDFETGKRLCKSLPLEKKSYVIGITSPSEIFREAVEIIFKQIIFKHIKLLPFFNTDVPFFCFWYLNLRILKTVTEKKLSSWSLSLFVFTTLNSSRKFCLSFRSYRSELGKFFYLSLIIRLKWWVSLNVSSSTMLLWS